MIGLAAPILWVGLLTGMPARDAVVPFSAGSAAEILLPSSVLGGSSTPIRHSATLTEWWERPDEDLADEDPDVEDGPGLGSALAPLSFLDARLLLRATIRPVEILPGPGHALVLRC